MRRKTKTKEGGRVEGEESEQLFKICHVSSFVWSKSLAAHKHHNITYARCQRNKHHFGLTKRPRYTTLNMNIQEETQLTLALPGSTKSTKPALSTTLDLHLGTKHVVGWPPVRGNRKNIAMKTCKYVKVAVDGAPYLRKVDLEIYDGYDDILRAVDTMFASTNLMNEKKYMVTYEDKDGDWMLLGDVPWKMFVESCKRIRLMFTMEDNFDFGSRTTSSSSRCTGSSEKKK